MLNHVLEAGKILGWVVFSATAAAPIRAQPQLRFIIGGG